MNDQRTSYGTKDKRSSVQRTHIQTAITYPVRKHWTSSPSTSRSYNRQAGGLNTAGFQNLENPLQIKLFGFLLCLQQCNVINSVRSAFQSAFSKKAYIRVCFVVCKIQSRVPHFIKLLLSAKSVCVLVYTLKCSPQ